MIIELKLQDFPRMSLLKNLVANVSSVKQWSLEDLRQPGTDRVKHHVVVSRSLKAKPQVGNIKEKGYGEK